MSKVTIGHHISHEFDEELERIRNDVLSMGGLVEEQIAGAIEALVEADVGKADAIAYRDYEVNDLEVSIDEECTRILARRHPAASDLRLVLTIIKTITDLERIGDEAEKVARMAVKLAEADRPAATFVDLKHLGAHVRAMLRDALDAFARLDAEAALRVAREDLRVDKEYEAIMRQCITFMMEDPRTIRRVLDVIWCARSLERIGDHAKNLAEYVIFLVGGRDVRHTSLEEMQKAVGSVTEGSPATGETPQVPHDAPRPEGQQ